MGLVFRTRSPVPHDAADTVGASGVSAAEAAERNAETMPERNAEVATNGDFGLLPETDPPIS